MKQSQVFELDLTRINGRGDFMCPGCGAPISPDDCNQESYSILEVKVSSVGLEELVIRCSTCGSQLHLTGFPLLEKLTDQTKKKLNRKNRAKKPLYVSHV